MSTVLELAASAPVKVASGPARFSALRELVALPMPQNIGAATPEKVAQLVARVGDSVPFVVVCERAQLTAELSSPVDVLNDRNVIRHALSSELAADDKRADDDDDKLSADKRDELTAQRKLQSKRCDEHRADVVAQALAAYSAADESAAA